MKELEIEGTIITPYIHFSPLTGIMKISGRSIPENDNSFWETVCEWFDNYKTKPSFHTQFNIQLDYFNIVSSKKILYLFTKLKEIESIGLSVQVVWAYKTSDQEMYEVGQDLSFASKVPFDFQVHSDSLTELSY